MTLMGLSRKSVVKILGVIGFLTKTFDDTVDGRNPAPPVSNGMNYLSAGAGFQPSTVLQEPLLKL